jgi:hypothetical protein
MDIYNLGAVQSTTDGPGQHRRRPRPAARDLSFDTQEEADAARDAMQAIVARNDHLPIALPTGAVGGDP